MPSSWLLCAPLRSHPHPPTPDVTTVLNYVSIIPFFFLIVLPWEIPKQYIFYFCSTLNHSLYKGNHKVCIILQLFFSLTIMCLTFTNVGTCTRISVPLPCSFPLDEYTTVPLSFSCQYTCSCPAPPKSCYYEQSWRERCFICLLMRVFREVTLGWLFSNILISEPLYTCTNPGSQSFCFCELNVSIFIWLEIKTSFSNIRVHKHTFH